MRLDRRAPCAAPSDFDLELRLVWDSAELVDMEDCGEDCGLCAESPVSDVRLGDATAFSPARQESQLVSFSDA